MKVLINFVICCLCLNLASCVTDTYKAAVVDYPKHLDLDRYTTLIQDAAKSNADIIVLPTPDESSNGADKYDEALKTISEAAKANQIYVVAHLYEKTRCQSKSELVRSNLVFDKRGSVVTVYRKPLNNIGNCTTSSEMPPVFTTDFGVTFTLMMEEDLVLKTPGQLKNYIVAGKWRSEIPFLSAHQFSSSWAYVTEANLVSTNGIFAGKAGLKTSGRLSVVELNKNGSSGQITPPVAIPTEHYPNEDLSQYTIKPLDVEASYQGHAETVCHGKFCCDFYVKTAFVGSSQDEVGYGLAAFSGVRHFGGRQYIGAQSCAVFACAGRYKRSCSIGATNTTNVLFDKVSITANFTGENMIQFPLILSTNRTPIQNFKFNVKPYTKTQTVSTEICNTHNLLSFSIFGRDFAKDYTQQVSKEGLTIDVYEFLFNEDVMEFFDYVWIRLRILLVIVSIYVLEMM